MQHAQLIAARTVRRVLRGASLAAALAAANQDASSERALVQELAYGTLRFLGQLRAIVGMLAKRPLVDEDVEALLWIALYQLIHTGAPPHVVVDCAVRAITHTRRVSAKGLVNAILRNFLRRRQRLLATVASEAEARFSYPRWWIERVRGEYPECYAAILDAGNARPPLSLRVNRRQLGRNEYLAALAAAEVAATAIGDDGVIVAEPRSVSALPGYAEGWFSVQDAGAQVAAPLLGARDAMRVLDACAAPGGKTTHLAELAALDLVALDNDSQRLKRVSENLARLKLSARLVVGDAADPQAWWDGIPYDRILADVPCSASGVVRRHPDAKWLRRETDIEAFCELQRRIIDALWPCLAPGGLLLYATCSIFNAENQEQIAAFLTRHPDASRAPPWPSSLEMRDDGQLLPAGGDAAHNHDGFFYALLKKN